MLSQALRALKRSHSADDDTSSERRRAEALLEVPKGIFMDIFSSSSGNAVLTSLDESPQAGLLLDTESIVLPPPPTVGLEMVRSQPSSVPSYYVGTRAVTITLSLTPRNGMLVSSSFLDVCTSSFGFATISSFLFCHANHSAIFLKD